ncbi:hypothetical protein [Telmatospirillum sp. J64-1]|uniref:hypothetical protein n=1 Tax=Telmatospirillum sp. J64-1 TaxID=2502183 RepID=UPI00115D935C|nr:hypothetical protein [Telmatospirillum sp. J64-1]
MSALDSPPPPPLTMDSLEDLRAYLARTHRTIVAEDDPILMLYTIHRVALDEFMRLLDRQEQALSDQVRATGENLKKEVETLIEGFKSEALGAAVRERIAAMQEAARMADTAQDRFRKNLRLLSILTALNFAAVVFTLGVLTVLTR